MTNCGGGTTLLFRKITFALGVREYVDISGTGDFTVNVGVVALCRTHYYTLTLLDPVILLYCQLRLC